MCWINGRLHSLFLRHNFWTCNKNDYTHTPISYTNCIHLQKRILSLSLLCPCIEYCTNNVFCTQSNISTVKNEVDRRNVHGERQERMKIPISMCWFAYCCCEWCKFGVCVNCVLLNFQRSSLKKSTLAHMKRDNRMKNEERKWNETTANATWTWLELDSFRTFKCKWLCFNWNQLF